VGAGEMGWAAAQEGRRGRRLMGRLGRRANRPIPRKEKKTGKNLFSFFKFDFQSHFQMFLNVF
jgi:hypothetical protein